MCPSSTRRSRSPTSTTKAELRDFAEAPAAHTPFDPRFKRFVDERFVLLLGPTPEFTNVQRPRLGNREVESTLAEIRDLTAQHGHHNAEWWIAPAATPPDLADRLLGLGLRPHEQEPELVAMILEQPPNPGPDEIRARVVKSEQEMLAAAQIQWEAFAVPDDEREAQKRGVADRFRAQQEHGFAHTFLAWVDGKPAACAVAVFAQAGVLLVGGSTSGWARGRGAYRALVRARWDAAVQRGTPALVVQAGSLSEPILRRLGFVELCRMRQLVDVGGTT